MESRASFHEYDENKYFFQEVVDGERLRPSIFPTVIKTVIQRSTICGLDEIRIGGNQARKALMPSLKNTTPPRNKKQTRDIDALFLSKGISHVVSTESRRKIQKALTQNYEIDFLKPSIIDSTIFSLDGVNVSFAKDGVRLLCTDESGIDDFFHMRLRIIREDRPPYFYLLRFLKIAVKCRHFEIPPETVEYFCMVPEYRPFVECLLNFVEERDLFAFHDNDNLVAMRESMNELKLSRHNEKEIQKIIREYFSSYFLKKR